MHLAMTRVEDLKEDAHVTYRTINIRRNINLLFNTPHIIKSLADSLAGRCTTRIWEYGNCFTWNIKNYFKMI